VFLLVSQPFNRVQSLEKKLKASQDEKARSSMEDALITLRRHLNQPRIRNFHIDAHMDSTALLGSWQSKGGSNSKINDVIKAILQCSQEFNFLIDNQYVPSAGNPANASLHRHSDLDCNLSEETWSRAQRMFGPHTFDLMWLDSNCCCDQLGNCLQHFTPCHTPESSSINVFVKSPGMMC